MSLEKYKKIKYLGKGSYGSAILVSLKSNPRETFVIKEILIGHLKPAEQNNAKKEVDVLKKMKHSNITEFFESFIYNSKLYIVMEHADGGDLSAAITRRKSSSQHWPEEEVMRIFVQICLALKHVHNHNVLHRDLKSQNIFLTSKGIVKLGDFGISKVLEDYEAIAQTQIGTPYYLSPEICDSRPYGRPSDIWALGVVLYELLALELPFQAQSLPALVVRIVSGEPHWNKISKLYTESLVLATKAMLNKDPDLRPSVRDLLCTDFFKMHITKLLSHTLLNNKGGAEADAVTGEEDRSRDVDETEELIERERLKQKSEEEEKERKSKEYQEAKLRLQKQEESREMLKKKKQEGVEALRRQGSDESIEVYAPSPPRAQGNNNNNNNHGNYDRDRDMFRDDISVRSDYDNNYNNRKQSVNPPPRAHVPSYHQEVVNQRQQHNQNAGAFRDEMRARDVDLRQGYGNGRAGGGNGYGNANGNGNVNDRHADELRQIYLENQALARENKNRIRPNEIGNNNNNLIVQQRQQSDVMSHHAARQADRNKELESAGKREYEANRLAAQQIKAKVEAYDRGAGYRVGIGMGMAAGPMGGGGAQAGPPRNLMEEDEDEVSVDVYRQAHGQGHGEGRGGEQRGRGGEVVGENRIAMVKARREFEREKEKAEKEQQIRLAHEQQRLERHRWNEERKLRDRENLQQDISSFDDNNVDGQFMAFHAGGENEVEEESYYDRQRRREKQKEEEIKQRQEALELAGRQHREAQRNMRDKAKPSAAVAFHIDFNENEDTEGNNAPKKDKPKPIISNPPSVNNNINNSNNNINNKRNAIVANDAEEVEEEVEVNKSQIEKEVVLVSAAPRTRRSWGTPIAPRVTPKPKGGGMMVMSPPTNVSRGEEKSSNSSIATSNVNSNANGNVMNSGNSNHSNVVSIHKSHSEDIAEEVGEDEKLIALYGETVAREIQEDEEAVLRCLEERKGRETEAREHAKIVFKKLREKRKQEAIVALKQADAKETEIPKPTPSAKQQQQQQQPVSTVPKRPTLNDIMNSVSKATTEVNKAIDIGQARGYNGARYKHADAKQMDAKGVAREEHVVKEKVQNDEIGDELYEYSSDELEAAEVDDLERTLDSWLKRNQGLKVCQGDANDKNSKNGVKKTDKMKPNLQYNREDNVIEEENFVRKKSNKKNNDSMYFDYTGNIVENDGEVANLQCELANCLMNNDEEVSDDISL